MFFNATTVIPVPATEDTILSDRDSSPLQRTFVFRNLTTATLTLVIQYNSSGVWVDIDTSFTVGSTAIVTKNIVSMYQLRVRGSNGSNSNDLEVSLSKFYDLSLANVPILIRPVIGG